MEGLIWLSENWHGSNFFNHLMRFITFLGEMGWFWIVLAVFLLFFKKSRNSGFVMLISLGIGFILNDFILKNIFERARPFVVNPDFADFIKSLGMDFPSGYSFPSGHSYASFNCAVVLALFNKKMGWFTIPIASLIAFSRIFLCVHYPTDVLAGVLLGIITAGCVYLIYAKICKIVKAKKRHNIRQGKLHDKN